MRFLLFLFGVSLVVIGIAMVKTAPPLGVGQASAAIVIIFLGAGLALKTVDW